MEKVYSLKLINFETDIKYPMKAEHIPHVNEGLLPSDISQPHRGFSISHSIILMHLFN